MSTERINVTMIQRDMLLQPRAELHRDWIEEYALDMAAGASFPPVVVFFDGRRYWLADGFHRVYATEAAGIDVISADVRNGDRRDALRFALSANGSHGHRRTNEDKRRAVDIMLADKEWTKLPDLEIARICMVTHPFVAKRRDRLTPKDDDAEAGSGNGYHVADAEDCNDYTVPEAEEPVGDQGETWIEDDLEPPDADTEPAGVEPFDWAAAEVRRTAMDAIRAIAKLPPPPDVIDAWMKSNSYGEPIEVLQGALAWLGEFVALYRKHEPVRWQQVQMMSREEMHAAQ
jgi:ParB/Sulfiredoxin domain